MARLPTVASLIDSGMSVFGKEWKHLTLIVVLLSTPLVLISLGFRDQMSLYIPYTILNLILGTAIAIFITAITYYRYSKNKRIHSAGLYAYLQKKFFPVLATIILIGFLFMIAMALLIIPGIILGIISGVTNTALFAAGSFETGGTLSAFGLASLLIMVFFALVIGAFVATYFVFAVTISILTKKIGFRAINQSIKLVKGRWWNIFGRIFLLYFIAFIFVNIAAVVGLTLFGTSNAGIFISSMLQQITILPISLAMIIFYIDITSKPRKRDLEPKEVVKSKRVTVRKKETKKTTRKKAKKAPTKKKKTKRKK